MRKTVDDSSPATAPAGAATGLTRLQAYSAISVAPTRGPKAGWEEVNGDFPRPSSGQTLKVSTLRV
jgi:hypothetical protein